MREMNRIWNLKFCTELWLIISRFAIYYDRSQCCLPAGILFVWTVHANVALRYARTHRYVTSVMWVYTILLLVTRVGRLLSSATQTPGSWFRNLLKIIREFLSPFFLSYRGAYKSLARPTSRCILFDGENISFNASLVIYVQINSTNFSPIMIINRLYEHQMLLSL
jgi:hypothetical protein